MISRLLAVALLACAAMVALAAPSYAACPVEPVSLEQHTLDADEVFTGVIADRAVSGNTVTYAVDVERIYKGSLSGERVSVSTDLRPASCGMPFLSDGGSYAFFTLADSGDLSVDRRSGTAPAAEAYVARIEGLLGDGRPAVAPVPETATFTKVADAPADVQRLAAPGAALVIIGVLGLIFVAWRGRRRA